MFLAYLSRVNLTTATTSLYTIVIIVVLYVSYKLEFKVTCCEQSAVPNRPIPKLLQRYDTQRSAPSVFMRL